MMIKTLIVENSSATALDIKNKLIKLEFDIISIAANLKQAVKTIRQGAIDLVLVGYESANAEDMQRFLQQLNNKFKLPFILLCNSDNNDLQNRMIEFKPESILLFPNDEPYFNISLLLAAKKIENRKNSFIKLCKSLEIGCASEMLVVCNKKGQIKYIGKNTMSLFKNSDKTDGKKIIDFIDAPEIEVLKKYHRNLLKNHRINFKLKVSRKKEDININGLAEIYDLHHYETVIAITFTREQNKLGLSNNHILQEIFNNAPSPTLIINNVNEIVFINKSLVSLLSIEKDKLIGKKYQDLPIVSNMTSAYCPYPFPNNNNPDVQIIDFTNKSSKHTLLKTQNETIIDGDTLSIISFTEITGCFTLEEEQLRSEKKYRTIVNNSQDAIIVINDLGNIDFWNNSAERIIGYTLKEALGKNVDELIAHPKFKKQSMKQNFLKYAKTGKGKLVGQTFETEILAKDGKTIDVIASFNALNMDNRWYVMAILKDKSEFKKVKQELQQKNEIIESFIDNENVWVSFFDANKNIQIWNKAAERISGYRKVEIADLDTLFCVAFPNKTYRESIQKGISNSLRTKSNTNQQIRITDNNGKAKSLSLYAQEIKLKSSDKSGILWIAYDITPHSIDQKDFETRIEEKEILIKEIHHRVKNNLQVMNSLVNLQSKYIDDIQAIEHFRETQNRIRTMSLIQETIYHSKNFTKLDFTDFIEKHAQDLLVFYGFSDGDIHLKFKKESIFVDINIAVSFGLLINEILTNALKYAFGPDSSENIIKIDFNFTKKNYLTYIVSDNGSGIPDDINWNDPDSLGLQLIQILASQIDAEIEQKQENGTKYTITLSLNNITKE